MLHGSAPGLGVRISEEKEKSPPKSPQLPPFEPALRGKAPLIEMAETASVGLEMGVSVAVGYFVGAWMDRKLGTDPWLMLVFLLCGVAAGFKGLLRASKKMRQSASQTDSNSKLGPPPTTPSPPTSPSH